MKAAIVLFIVLAVLFLLSRVRLGGQVKYGQDGLLVKLRLGLLKFTVFPGKKKEPKKKKKEKESDAGAELEKKDEGGTLTLVKALLPVAAQAAGELRRKIRVDHITLHLTWRSDDPMKYAMGYGYANGAVGMIWPLLDNNFNIKKRDIQIDALYEPGEPTIRIDGALSLTVGQGLSLALRLGIRFLRVYYQHKGKKSEQKEAKVS